MFGDDDGNDGDNNGPRPKRKKVLPDAKALLRKATKQLTNLAQNASNKTSSDFDEAQSKSRAERAARRSSSTVTLRSQTDVKLRKRHSTSSVAVATGSHSLSLTRLTSANKSTNALRNVLSSIKDRSSKSLQPSISKTNHKMLPSRKSSSESANALLPENRLRQSKLSFDHGNLAFEDPDSMQVGGDTNESKDQDPIVAELQLSKPRIARSVVAGIRSSAARSIKGPQRAAAIVRIGLKGNEAVRKTIRQVSGAEE